MKTERILSPPTSKALKSGRVILSPGEEIGEHVTDKREELLIVLKGTATVVQDDRKKEISAGETHFITSEIRHNVINKTDEAIEYIYVVSLFGDKK